MQASSRWPRFEEPFRHTLARNVALAAVVGAVLALLGHDLKLLLPLAALALWPSLGGHYIELAFQVSCSPESSLRFTPSWRFEVDQTSTMGTDREGRAAVQLIGARFREDLLLDAAQAVEDRAPVLTPIQPRMAKQ
jgi:hypothetical protein